MKYVFMAILADDCRGCMIYKELTERNLIKAINIIPNVIYKRNNSKHKKSVKTDITKLVNSKFFDDIELEFLPCLIMVPREQFENNSKKYNIEVFGKNTINGDRPGFSLGNVIKWIQKVITKVVITKNGLPIEISKSLENIEFIEAYYSSDSEEYLSRT